MVSLDFTHSPFGSTPAVRERPALRAPSEQPPRTRIVIGPPLGDGRVAFVKRVEATEATSEGDQVLISLYGHTPGEARPRRLLRAAIRRCDLWNGDFDTRLATLVRWLGWAITRIERREMVASSA